MIAGIFSDLRPTGAGARSVVIEKKYGRPIDCDDGVTFASQLRLTDPTDKPWCPDDEVGRHSGDELGEGTRPACSIHRPPRIPRAARVLERQGHRIRS
jgi:hypothetical protein